MLPNIFFILPVLELLECADLFLNYDFDDDDHDDNIFQILGFINIIPLLLDVLINMFEVTKDNSRENDAYKLIRFCANYRYCLCQFSLTLLFHKQCLHIG